MFAIRGQCQCVCTYISAKKKYREEKNNTVSVCCMCSLFYLSSPHLRLFFLSTLFHYPEMQKEWMNEWNRSFAFMVNRPHLVKPIGQQQCNWFLRMMIVFLISCSLPSTLFARCNTCMQGWARNACALRLMHWGWCIAGDSMRPCQRQNLHLPKLHTSISRFVCSNQRSEMHRGDTEWQKNCV